MRSETFTITTGDHADVFDLTAMCSRFIVDEVDGLLNVFVPPATAGLAIIETGAGAGAGSDDDLLTAIDHSGCGWAPAVGHLQLGTCNWAPAIGHLQLGTCNWAPGNRSVWSTPIPTTRNAPSG
jgi:thiamine phosphate synthase YjbQ (UPF0047 family)